MPVTAEINVIALMDVTLVLLVIFMITAPIMQGGIEVQLPRAEARPITQNDGIIEVGGYQDLAEGNAQR
jgi:biopolymer transport protein ExbD